MREIDYPLKNVVTGVSEQVRTPTTYKTVTLAAAPATTDVWTPAAGKKFRLMGGNIICAGFLAAAAIRKIQLIEETLGAIGIEPTFLAPTLAINNVIPLSIPGNGYISTTVDKKLQAVVTGATYTTGVDCIMVWGTEE